MRTRRGLCYPKLDTISTTTKTTTTFCFETKSGGDANKTRNNHIWLTDTTTTNGGGVGGRTVLRKCVFNDTVNDYASRVEMPRRKRAKVTATSGFCVSNGDGDGNGNDNGPDFFDGLPDDLVVCILAKLGSSASCPADFINALITCKRFNGLGLNSMVLSKASPKTFGVKAENWSESSHKFLKLCSDSGNVEASYTLGMIRFYCLQNRGSGASLMAKAAIHSHAQALYSLAVIQFNGSGGPKSDKDLRAGVALCARAAFLGQVDALRELGHCLQDGYGVRQNVAEGRRFLVQANARELAASLACSSSSSSCWVAANNHGGSGGGGVGCPLLSDFGCNVPAPEAHQANKFMAEWWAGREVGPGLRLCSHAGCGRAETRRHEFRRCSVCGAVNYCSRACQALDWKLRHKVECTPMPARWGVDGEDANNNGGGEVVGMEVDEGDHEGGQS